MKAALFDLDGVIRHFDPEVADRVAASHGLTRTDLYRAGFAPELLRPLVTGELTRAAWTELVGERLGAPDAAREWLADVGYVDEAVLDLVREVRAAGVVVAILTNGTDRIDAELDALGIAPHVDRVFNTWHLGVAKPDAGAYTHACTHLGCEVERVFFTDDTPKNVDAARALGMAAHHFDGVDGLREALAHARSAR